MNPQALDPMAAPEVVDDPPQAEGDQQPPEPAHQRNLLPPRLVVNITRFDWMDDLAWLKERRQQLLDQLLKEAGHLTLSEHECLTHMARVDALKVFDQRIAELDR